MRSEGSALVPLAVAAVVLGLSGSLTACADQTSASYVVVIERSAYSKTTLSVPAGRPLILELRNDDPIDHEWIVGDDAVHARHRDGTELAHADSATEVTVPAKERRSTRVVFDQPGDYRYVCHLPGHEAYGMVGVLRVV